MRNKILFGMTMIGLLLCASCKKNEDKSFSELILGQWTMDSTINVGKNAGATFRIKSFGTSLDSIVSFVSNGTIKGYKDTVTGNWSLNGTSLFKTVKNITDTTNINRLNESSMVLYKYGYVNSNNYYEKIAYYKKK
jgi:hypothetical protein